jgi:hypothetical protein
MNHSHKKAAATLPLVRWAIYPYLADRKLYDIDGTPGDGWQGDGPDAAYPNRQGKHDRSLRAARASDAVRSPAPKRQQPAFQEDNDGDNP